ncbi:right-handed parallel beta-helix repeat-containing protein [Sphingomonas sp. Ag1]|uniref:right-handed parallel beta-helix repeat-containing protein n=1 Tax=Sphingomonas sp. Ag1 TaxID=1642949 RepID=UPI001E438544|nr:right-handed parallel beta-helix repeat-containing protein [Sphingomonas sp. Ag1]
MRCAKEAMIMALSRRALLAVAASGTLARAAPVRPDGADPQDRDAVSLRDHGADPSGATSSVAAFAAALAAGRRVTGAPGDVYLLDAPVVVPAGRAIIGNGGTLKIGANAIGLKLAHDGCEVSGWSIRGNNGRYAVLNTGRGNTFSNNVCTGDIGHFFFSTGADHVTAIGNRVEGLSAGTEITTAIVMEKSRHITVKNNHFEQIPVGWSVQIRDGSSNFVVADNSFLQTRWTDSRKAMAGQRVFTFDLKSRCHLKKVQINGRPLSLGYAISGAGPSYTVTFQSGRAAGEIITLVGYRGAENIQINTGSHDGVITGNTIDGTGDSGIICLGSHLLVTSNTVRNCGYAGIAIYGDQNYIAVTNNTIADCAQLDDGRSSPDDPRLASVFAGAILASGEEATITGNRITNDAGTMRYAIRINKANMALRTDGGATIAISGNRISGDYADGRISAPNETTGARINSIAVDGPEVRYPGTIDLDRPWINAPPPDDHFGTKGFGKTWAIRDTAVRKDGAASLRTIAGEHVEFALLQAAILRNCNVTVSFWAKAVSGSSYVSVFTALEGLLHPLTAQITATTWKRYTISFPLTAKLADTILIRCGATSGSANIQHIAIVGHRL